MRVADARWSALARSVVLDAGGREIPLADCWSTGPAILSFLRHFG